MSGVTVGSVSAQARDAQTRVWRAVWLLPVAAVGSAATYLAVVAGQDLVVGSGSGGLFVESLAWLLPSMVYVAGLVRVGVLTSRAHDLGADRIVPILVAVVLTLVNVPVFLASEFVLAVLVMGVTGTFPAGSPL